MAIKFPATQIHWEMIKLAFSSKSKLAIIPMQDVLGLGAEARMNLPATMKNNWVWRFSARPNKAENRQKSGRFGCNLWQDKGLGYLRLFQ